MTPAISVEQRVPSSLLAQSWPRVGGARATRATHRGFARPSTITMLTFAVERWRMPLASW